MVVLSLGSLVDATPAWTGTSVYGSLTMYDQFSYDYATLYRTQPNIRTCVDFLARNIAQLGLHTFRRVSDTDRQRLTTHPLAVLLGEPNPHTTRYRLIESLMGDLGVHFRAYWLKLLSGGERMLLRIPPDLVTVHGYLAPTQFDVSLPTKTLHLAPDQVVHFGGYNPESSVSGLSPLETLRRVLAEEQSMGDYREYFWRNAARQNGVITRPKDAPDWSDTARERFKAEFEALYSGAVNSGKTAILEEGMDWKPTAFSAQESEYLLGRKLTREECARAYHIPLPMVGILDHATFSNISEQHRNLYQDSLGPWLTMISEEIELQLLPWVGDGEGVYCEFNIAEKLAGSFKEQVEAFQSAVGRSWMAPDEARARMNLPSMGGDAAKLGTPLNVLIGGQASLRDSAPKMLVGTKAIDDRTTAWLGCYLPADVAEALAVEGGESPEALHMTLAYLGPQSPVDLARLPDVVERWASTAASLNALVSGVGRFNASEPGGAQPFYASVDAPGLPEWRQGLVDYLASQGFKVDLQHGFTPHITLAYVAADAPNPIETVPDLRFVFDKLTLSLGDVRRDYLLTETVKRRRLTQGIKAAAEIDPTLLTTRERHVEKWAEVLRRYFGRQESALIGRVTDGATIEAVYLDGARWDAELGDDLLKLSTATALVFARYVAEQLAYELDEARMANYLKETSRISAEEINLATRDRLAAALLAEIPRDAVKGLFEEARTSQAERTAVSKVTSMSSFGAHEGASQGGLKTKTWHDNSSNPRNEHAAMNGQTVAIGARFSNGGRWPGDPVLGAAENANCICSVSFGR